MAFLEIRVPIVVSLFLIVLGLPASVAFLLFGLGGLADPTNTNLGLGPGLVFIGVGVFLLLMAIAAFRGILHRKRN